VPLDLGQHPLEGLLEEEAVRATRLLEENPNQLRPVLRSGLGKSGLELPPIRPLVLSSGVTDLSRLDRLQARKLALSRGLIPRLACQRFTPQRTNTRPYAKRWRCCAVGATCSISLMVLRGTSRQEGVERRDDHLPACHGAACDVHGLQLAGFDEAADV